MRVLTGPTEIFDLNQSDNCLLDLKYCVYDYSDPDEMDFYMRHITSYSSYKYPTVTLLIDGKYHLEIPANWNIMSYDNVCELSSIDEFLHRQCKIPMFNPFYIGIPKLVDVEVIKINPNYVEHFCPRIPKKNILALPVGGKNDGIEVNENGKKIIYPYCIFGLDNADISKCNLNLYDDMLNI